MTYKTLAALAALSMLAAACGERSAESETATAEAEVSTSLPEEVVSDQELQALADQAAAGAGSSTVATDVPPPTTGQVPAQPAPAEGAAQPGQPPASSGY